MRLTWLALVVSVMITGTAAGATLSVDCAGGGDYLTIQEAVDAAAHLDTILIAPCVYNERVEIIDKVLVLRGSGADVTELRWGGGLEPLYIDTTPASGERVGTVAGMTIAREEVGLPAITWQGGWMKLEDCVVEEGTVTAYNGDPPVGLRAYRCDIASISIHGSGGYSRIEDCRVGAASFSGYSLYSGAYHAHSLYSAGSEYGALSVSITYADMSDDSVDALEIHPLTEFVGTDCRFGEISSECGYTSLTHCTVEGRIDVWGEAHLGCEYCGGVRLVDCLVHGVVGIDVTLPGWYPGQSSLRLVNNTFLGSIYCLYSGGGFVWEAHVINNIVMGLAAVGGDAIDATYNTAFVHNDFYGGAYLQAYVDSIFGNFSEDPLFCDAPLGDYGIQECSPCVGAGLNGADIGAFDIGCECETAVEDMTWGRVKGLFR